MELRIKHTPETALSTQELSDQMTLQIDFTQGYWRVKSVDQDMAGTP